MNNMDLEKIGKFIATLRKDKNLTQLQLAELIDASAKTVSKWENGSFPDIAYQSNLCKVLGIELDELHAGELNYLRRRRRRIRKIMNRIVIFYAAITIPLIILLCLFFIHNFDATKIYKVRTGDSSIEAIVNGLLIETNKANLLYIGNINLLDYEAHENDIISVDIYSEEKSVFHSNKLDSLVVKYNDEKKIDKNDLKIKVFVTDNKKRSDKNYEVKLTAVNISSDDNQIKTPVLSELEILSDEQIIENLKKEGFKQIDNDWKKIINKNNKEISLLYTPSSKKFSYVSNSDTIMQNIIFSTTTNFLEVYQYHWDKNSNTLVEKYTYSYETDELDCQVGVCSSVDKVKKTMKSYISLLIAES